jgi:hypothetical protein
MPVKKILFIPEPQDERIIHDLMRRNGFGKRGKSAALRFIIREYDRMQRLSGNGHAVELVVVTDKGESNG